MTGTLPLALRYLRYYRGRSIILIVCVSIAIFLPTAIHVLVGYYQRVMIRRAEQTPLVIGPAGGEYDLVLNALYFKGRLRHRLTMGETRRMRSDDLAMPVPMLVHFTARKQPIVGTTLDYFRFRGLRVARGTLPRMLGDAVLGAGAAERLDLSVGDKLLSDREKLYDPSAGYPLRMRIVGVLAESGTADDLAVFTDIKTTWVIDGVGHGHDDAQKLTDPSMIRPGPDTRPVLTGAVVQDNEVTLERLGNFHFHRSEDKMPVTAVIAVPRDAKSATILAGRYRWSKEAQAVVPREVVREMMGIVARVVSFLDAIFATVLASTGLFLLLVILLSLRIRRREIQTLHRIGCSRWTVFALQGWEVALVLTVSTAVAAATLGGLMWYVIRFDVLL